MEGNEKDKKEKEFRELMYVYSEMGDKLFAMAKELGHFDEKKEELRKELETMIGHEFLVFQIEEIKHKYREEYLVQVTRKLPIEKETGKAEINLDF